MPQNTKYKRLLADKEIDQKSVAEKVGISQSMLNLIVNGYSNITIRTLKKLCLYHQVSPNEILDWENWKSGKTK
jgi:DNA-binding Xre family transcriptional regulator